MIYNIARNALIKYFLVHMFMKKIMEVIAPLFG